MNMIFSKNDITAKVITESVFAPSKLVFFKGREVIQFTENSQDSSIAIATLSERIQDNFKQVVINGILFNVNPKSLDSFIFQLIKKEYNGATGDILGPNPKPGCSDDVVYVEVKENKFTPNNNIGVSVARIRGIFCIEILKSIVNSGVEK